MDLHTVTRVRRPARADEIASWGPGFAWLAGGTWLFSEPQAHVHTLIDLESLGWPSLRASADGLEIASTCKVAEFVTGNHQNVLAPGELLRSIFLPAHALRKKFAFRRFALTHLGRSEALLIGTRCPGHGEFVLTITAATLRPIQLRFEGAPAA